MSVAARSLPLAAGERWCLVNTLAGREAIAAGHLERQGYTPFLPSTWRTTRHARQLRTVRAALFPGYLFVALDIARDRWRPIDGTVGVVGLVKAGDRPLAAPAGFVEALLEAVDADGVLDRAGGDLRPGQTVRIIRGPFAEQLGMIERLNGAERVCVLLSIMNQKAPVELRRSDVAIA